MSASHLSVGYCPSMLRSLQGVINCAQCGSFRPFALPCKFHSNLVPLGHLPKWAWLILTLTLTCGEVYY